MSESSIWSNIFGALAALLFLALLGGILYRWQTWSRDAERRLAWAGIAAGGVQILVFVVLASVLRVGWTGSAGDNLEAQRAIEGVRAAGEGLVGVLDGATARDVRKTYGQLDRLSETFGLRPTFGLGLYWLTLVAVALVALGARALRPRGGIP